MAGKQIVTSTVNQVSFKVDRNSYDRAIRAVKAIKTAWLDANKAFSQSGGIAKASRQIEQASRQLQNSYARTAAAQREEIRKTASYAIAQQRRASKALGGGVVGSRGWYDSELVRRQGRAMGGGPGGGGTPPSPQPPRPPRVSPEQRAAARAEAERARRVSAQSIADVRLRAKYGDNYARRLGGGLQGVRQLNQELAAGTISIGRYRAGISALETQFRQANTGAKGFSGAIKEVKSGLLQATSAYTLFSAGKGIMQTGQAFQGINAGLAMTSENAVDAQQKLEFLKGEAKRLGLDLQSASQAYMKLSISSRGKITSDQANSLFTGVSELSTAMGLDTYSQSGAIYAIQQMLSKGKVSSQELNQQLAERLPGSVQIFVEALQELRKNSKLTETDLYAEMKAGKLLSKDILPLVAEAMSKAARRGGALEMMLKGNGVAMRRLGAEWQNAQNIIFQSGFGDALTSLFNNLAENISNNSPVFRGIGEFFAGIIEFGEDMFNGLNDFFVLTDAVIKHYSEKWGVDLPNILNWAGYAAGMGATATALFTVFKILSWITGLRAALAAVAGAITIISGGAGAAAGAAGGAAGAAGGAARGGLMGKGLGLLGLGALGYGAIDSWVGSTNASIDATSSVDKYNKVFGGFSWTDLFSATPTVNNPGMFTPQPAAPFSPMGNFGNMPDVTAKVDPITINLELKAAELKGLIEASVQDNNTSMINLLLQDAD